MPVDVYRPVDEKDVHSYVNTPKNNQAHKTQKHSKNIATLPYVVARFPFILSRQVFLARLDAL